LQLTLFVDAPSVMPFQFTVNCPFITAARTAFTSVVFDDCSVAIVLPGFNTY